MRRPAIWAALCGTVVLAGGIAAWIAGLGSAALSGPRPMPRPTTSITASLCTPDPVRNEAEQAACSVEVADMRSVSAASPDSHSMARTPALTVLLAAVSPTDPVPNVAEPAISSEAPDACLNSDVCIDQYLWSLYERTPKVDTVKVTERIKETVKDKVKVKDNVDGKVTNRIDDKVKNKLGDKVVDKVKTRTVVKTLIKYITEDFAWKDPKAARKVGMSLKDYVIGGMDRGFKRKLFDALRAMDDAGFSPGITSGFRDNYRQELTSGNKAATDSSYHGGSRRGGYGHGLAADLVSVKGETRAERLKSTEILWKWIDANEKELGIGRPYRDKDPPHVAPIDGKEYSDKRGLAKARLAGLKKPSQSSIPK